MGAGRGLTSPSRPPLSGSEMSTKVSALARGQVSATSHRISVDLDDEARATVGRSLSSTSRSKLWARQEAKQRKMEQHAQRAAVPERESAALLIQWHWRSQCAGRFGPRGLQARHRRPVEWGNVAFGGREAVPTADWVRVPAYTSPRRVISLMLHHWRMTRPLVLISVSGGAQAFDVDSATTVKFAHGLATAASATSAWVVSGGMHSGIMKMVGEAASMGLGFELLGIAPWGAVRDRDELSSAFANHRPAHYGNVASKTADASGAPLDPNHNRFVLVDSGQVGSAAWGSEIHLRSQMEGFVRREMGVATCLVVLQGGRNTLTQVLEALREGVPVLLFRDTGGMAGAIADYLTERAERDHEAADAVHMPAAVFQGMGPEERAQARATLAEVYSLRQCPDEGSQLLFTADASLLTAKALEEAVLECILAGQNDLAKLELIVSWNRPDLLVSTLETSSVSMRVHDHQRKLLGHCMQLALHTQRSAIVRTLVEQVDYDVATLRHVDFVRLYTVPEHPFGLLESSPLLRALKAGYAQQHAVREVPHAVQMRFYLLHVVPFVERFMPGYRDTFAVDVDDQEMRALGFEDLFVWALCMGDAELIRVFWERSDEPLLLALQGSCMLRGLALESLAPRQYLEELAATLEGWAVAVVDAATSYPHALGLLRERSLLFDGAQVVTLALQDEHKAFMCCKHAVTLVDEWWRASHPRVMGSRDHVLALSPDTSYAAVLLQVLMPLAPDIVTWTLPRHVVLERGLHSTLALTGTHLPRHLRIWRNQVHLYTVPMVKFVVQTTLALGFLAVLTTEVVIPAHDIADPLLLLLLLWCVALVLHEVVQGARQGYRAWVSDFWNWFDVALPALVLTSIVMRVAAEDITTQSNTDQAMSRLASMSTNDAWTPSQLLRTSAHEVLSVACMCFYARMLQTFTVTKPLGMLVSTFLLMFRDMVPWFCVFVCFTTGFMFMFYGFAVAYYLDTPGEHFPATAMPTDDFLDKLHWREGTLPYHFAVSLNYNTPYWAPYWAIFGMREPGEDFPLVSPVWGPIMLYLYQFITTVLLINLLIAILSDTYATHKDRADQEWRFNRAMLVEGYVNSHWVSPPFNLVFPWATWYAPYALLVWPFALAAHAAGVRNAFTRWRPWTTRDDREAWAGAATGSSAAPRLSSQTTRGSRADKDGGAHPAGARRPATPTPGKGGRPGREARFAPSAARQASGGTTRDAVRSSKHVLSNEDVVGGRARASLAAARTNPTALAFETFLAAQREEADSSDRVALDRVAETLDTSRSLQDAMAGKVEALEAMVADRVGALEVKVDAALGALSHLLAHHRGHQGQPGGGGASAAQGELSLSAHQHEHQRQSASQPAHPPQSDPGVLLPVPHIRFGGALQLSSSAPPSRRHSVATSPVRAEKARSARSASGKRAHHPAPRWRGDKDTQGEAAELRVRRHSVAAGECRRRGSRIEGWGAVVDTAVASTRASSAASLDTSTEGAEVERDRASGDGGAPGQQVRGGAGALLGHGVPEDAAPAAAEGGDLGPASFGGGEDAPPHAGRAHASSPSPPGGLSPERLSPERLSPERLSPERLSPERLSPERLSPERLSPERLSPGGLSPHAVHLWPDLDTLGALSSPRRRYNAPAAAPTPPPRRTYAGAGVPARDRPRGGQAEPVPRQPSFLFGLFASARAHGGADHGGDETEEEEEEDLLMLAEDLDEGPELESAGHRPARTAGSRGGAAARSAQRDSALPPFFGGTGSAPPPPVRRH